MAIYDLLMMINTNLRELDLGDCCVLDVLSAEYCFCGELCGKQKCNDCVQAWLNDERK